MDHSIPFDEFDIDRSSRALQELVELTGSATHVPVMEVDGETLVDFNENIASRVLELVGK
jgi:prophage tail gpP-like protein